MRIIHIVICALVIPVNVIHAQSCKTPNKKNGKCVDLFECQSLIDLIYKKDRTETDLAFVRNSSCDSRTEIIPKVCCLLSDNCTTPDGQPGKCINLWQCTSLVEKLQGPNRGNYIEYAKNSVCQGPEDRSVCCGTSSSTVTAAAVTTWQPPTTSQPLIPLRAPETTVNSCSNFMTANPPERNSLCCGRDATTINKIFGDVTWIDEYPWLVVIEYLDLTKIKLYCGGSLISGKYVLTAGHCVKGRILNKGIPKNVRLGEYNTTSNGPDCIQVDENASDCTKPVQIVPIEKIIPHPLYKPYGYQQHHDIALIRLSSTAPYTEFIRPICLPSMDYTVSPPEQFKLMAAGWGQYKQDWKGRGENSDVKRDVELPYVDRTMCQTAQRSLSGAEFIEVNQGQLCAGGEAGRDSCKGDSGGPLMYEKEDTFELIGVVSYGAGRCGLANMPGVYTSVYAYVDWIKSQIEP